MPLLLLGVAVPIFFGSRSIFTNNRSIFRRYGCSFIHLQAHTNNHSGDKVVLQSEQVANPVAVRFSWAGDAGENNVFDKEGFPAAPFRTDNWKGITDEIKYRVE